MSDKPADLPLANEIFSILAIPDKPADQAARIMQLLFDRGHLIPNGPKAVEAQGAAQSFALQLIFARLTISLLRDLLLRGVILPETPQAMEWIKAYIDGDGHGPVGEPMLWPVSLLGTAALLRKHGFEPTQTDPPFVRKTVKPTVN